MAFTTVAFAQSVDPAAAFDALTAVLDQHVTVVGDDIRVPSLNQIVALAAGVEITAESFARLTAPSLRTRSLYSIEPFNTGSAAAVEPGSPPAVVDLRRTPIAMVVGENLNFEVNSDPAAAQAQWCVVWFADGPIAPVSGSIFTVRGTGATTLTAITTTAIGWTNVPLTFIEDLPRGRYQVVGMRARSAGCVAARLSFVTGGPRPGVLGVDAQGDLDHRIFRYGEMGVFGEFEDTDPPSMDFLSVAADTAEDFYLDLIQTRSGPG